jgi:hypothetical protein
VLIGGNSKHGKLTTEHGRELAAAINAKASQGSVLITSSRRSDPQMLDALEKHLRVPHVLYRYGGAGPNLYMSILAHSSRLIVTGDSVSMCSEACATGLPVSIYAPEGSVSDKLVSFHQALYEGGYASPLASPIKGKGRVLDDAAVIAEEIRSRGWV